MHIAYTSHPDGALHALLREDIGHFDPIWLKVATRRVLSLSLLLGSSYATCRDPYLLYTNNQSLCFAPLGNGHAMQRSPSYCFAP